MNKNGIEKIGFFVFKNIHIPHHLREYYVSLELEKAGWQVEWLLPASGKTSEDLTLNWPVVRYKECDFKGHKIVFPFYFAWFLKKRGIENLWISGWTQRDPDALRWFVKILKLFKVKIVYDTVDPIEFFNEAHSDDREKNAKTKKMMQQVYTSCDLILAVTPEIKEKIESIGVGGEKVFTCRWGTDISVFKPGNVTRDFRAEIGIDENTFLVGWLGSMNPFKGLKEILVPLIGESSRKLDKIHFVLAGYGLLEDELRSWAKEQPELPVTILGRIPYRDAASFTGSLDAYIVPTNPETDFAQSICPVKCFDGLAMGVDVLATRTRATEFLEGLTDKIHLCGFSVESFRNQLGKVMSNNSRKTSNLSSFGNISHQVVAKDVFRLITDKLGK